MSQINNTAVQPLSRLDIRNFANQIRQFSAPDSPNYFPVIDWFENILCPKIDFNYDYPEQKDMGDNHGLTSHEKRMIYIREDVYQRALMGHGRDRATIIHEVGHALLHPPQRVVHARNFKTPLKLKPYEDPEWQAKAFATEFLMPLEKLCIGMRVLELSNIFGISNESAKFQVGVYEREGYIKINRPANVDALTGPQISWKK